MRGKAKDALFLSVLWGITPAHAGKSLQKFAVCRVSQDHPRACGEKSHERVRVREQPGSPPRMRGKGLVVRAALPERRITPAHAGKSSFGRCGPRTPRDHPRACGEKPMRILWEHAKEGSPPRMRGKVCTGHSRRRKSGITPAHAGKSGKKQGQTGGALGSPPRMRGKEIFKF